MVMGRRAFHVHFSPTSILHVLSVSYLIGELRWGCEGVGRGNSSCSAVLLLLVVQQGFPFVIAGHVFGFHIGLMNPSDLVSHCCSTTEMDLDSNPKSELLLMRALSNEKPCLYSAVAVWEAPVYWA